MEIKIISKSVVPDRIVLYEGDTGGKNLVFSIKKVNDGISVEGLMGYLEIERDGGGSDRFLLEKTVGEEEVYFTLKINSVLTQTEDILSSQISLESEDKSIIYKTKVFFIEVKYSVDGDGSFEQIVPSVITELENKLNEAVLECNEIKESFDFSKEEFENTLQSDYQLKEDQSLETESKEVAGAINELKLAVSNVNEIKTVEPDENGEYKCRVYNMEDGIYYFVTGTKIQYRDNGAIYTTTSNSFLAVGSVDRGKYFTILPVQQAYMVSGYDLGTQGALYNINLNYIVTRNIENTFTQLQKISVTIPSGDNSTSIPTTAWVQNELSNISGLNIFKHTAVVNLTIDGIENSFNIYFYSLNDSVDTIAYDNNEGHPYIDIKAKEVLSKPYLLLDNFSNIESYLVNYGESENEAYYQISFDYDFNQYTLEINSISEVVERV